MKELPDWAVPYTFRGVKLLKVPELVTEGMDGERCTGCCSSALYKTHEVSLCAQVSDAHDCEGEGPPHIFIRRNKTALVEYLARRMDQT